MQKDYLGTVDINSSEAFIKFIKGICKTLKAEKHDISVVEVINLTERIDTVNGTNTIAKSVQKDNLVLEKKSIKIRQATKDGFVDCELGGGWWIWNIHHRKHAEEE